MEGCFSAVSKGELIQVLGPGALRVSRALLCFHGVLETGIMPQVHSWLALIKGHYFFFSSLHFTQASEPLIRKAAQPMLRIYMKETSLVNEACKHLSHGFTQRKHPKFVVREADLGVHCIKAKI